jgi:plastocyanin
VPTRTVLFALVLVPATAFAAGGTITGKVEATPPRYLPDTVVYLKNVPGPKPAPRTATLDQKGLKFVPHIVTIVAGDTVAFPNGDKVAHNVFSPEGSYNLGTFKPGEQFTRTFPKPGVYTQLCSIHPEMLGYIWVGDNPYAAAVDENGNFTIRDVPPGSYQIAVWNVKLKAADQSVTVTAGTPANVSFSLKR